MVTEVVKYESVLDSITFTVVKSSRFIAHRMTEHLPPPGLFTSYGYYLDLSDLLRFLLDRRGVVAAAAVAVVEGVPLLRVQVLPPVHGGGLRRGYRLLLIHQ
jgi:hypothetical protein